MDLSATRGFIVSYDVCDPKRLNRTRRVLLGFGEPAQLSVFYCELTPRDLVELKTRLAGVIKADEDQVLFADLGTTERAAAALSTLGTARSAMEHRAVVI